MLEQISAIASVVSALAIVASVVYASIQIRQNTRAVTAAAFQNVVDSFAEYSFEIGKDAGLADLCLRGNRDYHALSEAERMRYGMVHLSFLRRAENVLFQSHAHVLTAKHWSGIRGSVAAILSAPGARACWSEMKGRLNPEFQAFVATLLEE